MFNRRNLLLTLCWVVTLGSGWYGFYLLEPKAPVLSNVYSALQLFGLNGSFNDQPLPLGVEIARFAAPLLTVYTVILAFAGSFAQTARQLRARFVWRNHVIVCGLDERSLSVTQSLIDAGKRVVIIDPAANAETLPLLANHPRVVLVPLSATRPEAYRKAALDKAGHVIVVSANDSRNVEIWELARQVKGARDLTVTVHIQDPNLAKRLELNTDAQAATSPMPRLRLLNSHQLAVRQLFQRYPLSALSDAHGWPAPHLVVIGFGQMGRHVLLESIRLYRSENSAPLRVSIVDRQATQAWAELKAYTPGLEALCEVHLFNAPVIAEPQVLADVLAAAGPVAAWYVCLDDDSNSVRESLYLRQRCLQSTHANAPIFVRLRDSRGFEQLIAPAKGALKPIEGILAFGAWSDSMTCEVILKESLDQLARSVHQYYLHQLGAVVVPGAAQQPWADLGEDYRRASRQLADHLAVKLASVGISAVPAKPDEVAAFEFSPLEIDRLGECEHIRWCADRLLEGWQYGAERVNAVKLHPKLLPWDQLSPEVKLQNFDQVRALPDILRGVGLRLQRQLIVGVTGHRHYDDIEHVRSAIRATFQTLVQDHPDHQLILISALASGADQHVARIALDEFGAQLWAVAPFPLNLYVEDFAGTDRADLNRLLARATRYAEMPLRFGSLTAVASDQAVRVDQYALAGAYIAQRAQVLIAVWDGQPARGVGGTGAVVGWVNAGEVPQAFRFAGLASQGLTRLEHIRVTR